MPDPTLIQLEDKYFTPAFGGTRHSGDVVVIPHVDGEAYFSAIADALDKCQGQGDKIYIASWLFSPDFDLRTPSGATGSGPVLGKVLFDKVSLGADVRIILGTPLFSSGTDGVGLGDPTWWINNLVNLANEGIESIVQNNIIAALSLRNSKRSNQTASPFYGRVLMDWSGIDPDPRHEKTTIIYSESTKELRAFVGGIDFDSGRISNPLHNTPQQNGRDTWHDVGIEIHGSAAASALENFITRWNETATLPKRTYKVPLDDGATIDGEFNPEVEPTPPTQPAHAVHPTSINSPASVCILRSYEAYRSLTPWRRKKVLEWDTLPATPILEIFDVLQQAISSAQRYIYVEDQSLNPPSGPKAAWFKHDKLYPIISAACARGVKVIFVCNDGMTGTASPTMSSEITEKILDPLLNPELRRNFGLYWISGTRLHSKLVIVDDEFATIGSANLWDRSMNGFESELNAAFVHTGGQNSQVADLRVRLWLEHLRIPPGSNAAAEAELRNLDKGLGIFRTDWAATGLSFTYPGSALREIPL